MRKPLEKNEFLMKFEDILKKYGYTTVYCRGNFNGTKKGGIGYFISAEPNPNASMELNELVDPVWDLEEYDWHDMSGTGIYPRSKEAIEELGDPIYENGEFYAHEGEDY